MATPKSTLKQRKGIYYLHYFEHGVRKRVSLGTSSLRLAQDKQRQFDSARVRGEDTTLATHTPLADIVAAYVRHMQTRFTKRGFVSDLSSLRKVFGPICPQLEHGRRTARALRVSIDGRLREPVIAATYLEQITTAQISEFILERVRRHGLQPKTANRYRELIQRVFNWAMQERENLADAAASLYVSPKILALLATDSSDGTPADSPLARFLLSTTSFRIGKHFHLPLA